MVTTVFDASATLAGTDDGNGNSNVNFRQVIKHNVLSAATGNQVRITVLFGSSEGTENPAVDDLWFGQLNPTTFTAFDGNQVHVTFPTALNGAASQSYVSDWVTLGQNWDNTQDYLAAFHATNGASCHTSFASQANADQWGDSGGSSTSSQTNPLSFILFNTGAIAFIAKIEIQAAGPPPTPGPGGTLSMMGVG